MKKSYQLAGRRLELEVTSTSRGLEVTLPDGKTHLVDVSLSAEGVRIRSGLAGPHDVSSVPVARTDRGIEVSYQGRLYIFEQLAEGAVQPVRSKSSGSLVAPMVGVVANVLVREGDLVEAFQPIVVVEAMKVMATVDAPFSGVVKQLLVGKGDRVGHGALLAVIEVATSASPG